MLFLYSELKSIPSDEKTFWDKRTPFIIFLIFLFSSIISILLIVGIIIDLLSRDYESPLVVLNRIWGYF